MFDLETLLESSLERLRDEGLKVLIQGAGRCRTIPRQLSGVVSGNVSQPVVKDRDRPNGLGGLHRRSAGPAPEQPLPAGGTESLDLDHFKTGNDRWGRLSEGIVLRRLASMFCETMQSSDLIARFGGRRS